MVLAPAVDLSVFSLAYIHQIVEKLSVSKEPPGGEKLTRKADAGNRSNVKSTATNIFWQKDFTIICQIL